MIFGECPYCNEQIVNEMPERSPKFIKTKCEHCGKEYWLLASRIESVAYTEEGFNKEYTVDEETHHIRRVSNETENNC